MYSIITMLWYFPTRVLQKPTRSMAFTIVHLSYLMSELLPVIILIPTPRLVSVLYSSGLCSLCFIDSFWLSHSSAHTLSLCKCVPLPPTIDVWSGCHKHLDYFHAPHISTDLISLSIILYCVQLLRL